MSAEEESKSMSMDDTAGNNNTLAEPVAPVATESTDVTAAALAPAAPASAAVADAAAMADEESDSEPMASGNGKVSEARMKQLDAEGGHALIVVRG